MTAMKPVLEFFVDANILFMLAFVMWRLTHGLTLRGRLKHDYPAQLRLLKAALLITILSPLLALGAVSASQWLWPNAPITVSDIAVAAYLRGDIAIPAVQFESLLNTRSRIFEALLEEPAPWVTALVAVFTAGAVAFLLRIVHSFLRIRAAIARSYLWRRTARVDIRLSDTVSVPFAARGLLRRHVVLPSSLITRPRDLRYILAHEFQHLREGDIEWEIAFESLRALMFWNPAFLMWKRAFDHLRELACDQAVISRRRICYRDYSDCLLDFCQRRLSGPWPTAMHVAFVRSGSRSAKRALQDRILALQNAPTKDRRSALPVITCVLTLSLSLAAASVRQPGDWSQDRLMLSTIVNLERLEAINRGW